MIHITERTHQGVKYLNINGENKVEAAATIGDMKITYKGYPTINIIEGSYKYGKQIQLGLWCKKGEGEIINRTNKSKYDRIEIFLTPEQAKVLLEKTLEAINGN